MAVSTHPCDFTATMPAFTLPGTDGRLWRDDQIVGPRGTLVMFICNHCPYVQAILDRLVRDARELRAAGIGVAAISSNDAASYPEDGFDRLAEQARVHGFDFPYLYDEDQAVAKAFGAVCTPDFFGFNRFRVLQYRGRLDASGRAPAASDARRDLYEAMMQVARTDEGPRDQIASIGCSIKWRTA